jgi:L-ascorbate metabolism protein UlaG (beta-lactamase superfamily)
MLVEEGGVRVIIDPLLSGNPGSGIKPSDVKVDAVVLTHGHSDHFGDCIEIAKQNDCPIIAVYELAVYFRLSRFMNSRCTAVPRASNPMA